MTTSYTAYSLSTYATGPLGMAGRIVDNGTAITPYPNMKNYTGAGAGDPQVEGFSDLTDGLRIAATLYTGSGAPGVDIYDATDGSDIETDLEWDEVTNLYGLVKVGNYLYALDYDNARVVEIDPSTYSETSTQPFNFASNTVTAGLVPSGYTPRGQAIMNIGGTLYGLFAMPSDDWSTYQNSVLVRFTIAGGSAIAVAPNAYNNNIEKNAFAMAVQGSDLYIAGLGGKQNSGSPNTSSALEKIAYGATNLTTASVSKVFGYSATYPYEVRDISFNGSTAYVLMGAYDGSYVMEGVLLETDTSFSSFTTVDSFTGGSPGYFWAAQYVDNNRILFARGNEILYYDDGSYGTPAATLTISAGSLMASPETDYDSLNDVAYVGATGTMRVRGYRSPVQVSKTARGQQARAIAKGRPELTSEELERLEDVLKSN